MPDLTPQIQQAAAEPQSASSDGQSATNPPIGELVKADQYLAQREAAKRKTAGLRFVKLAPPGTV